MKIRIHNPIYGVPITYLGCHCNNQFKIVGNADADILPIGWKGMSESFVNDYYKQGNTGSYRSGNRLAHYRESNGLVKVPFKRILIQKL